MKFFRAFLIGAVLAAMPIASMAATKKSLNITEPVAVGDVVLQPGDYKVEWEGSGPNVQVSFVEGKKTLVTAPATLQNRATGYDQAIELKEGSNGGAKSLTEVDFKGMSLRFDQAGPSGQ